MTQTQTLTTRPIPSLIREIAVPASVGFFFNTLFNAVDTWWGGQISTQALAALSLSFPVFFIIIAVGSGLASGTTALIGTALGKGNLEEAETFSAQGISFGILISIFLTAVGLAGSRTLFAFLGASGEYLRICLAYMNVIFAGSIFFIVNHMFSAILNALGDTRPFRNFLIAGCLLNVLLDPWFIYGGFGVPPMSFAGIALATVLIQAMGCLYLCSRVRRTKLRGACGPDNLRPRLAAFREIARQGVPAAANFFTIGLGIFVITYFVSGFGKEAVAAYGAAMRIEQIILLPTIGLSTATLAIVAQNSGARLFDRMDETVRTALRYGGIIMLCGTVALLPLCRTADGGLHRRSHRHRRRPHLPEDFRIRSVRICGIIGRRGRPAGHPETDVCSLDRPLAADRRPGRALLGSHATAGLRAHRCLVGDLRHQLVRGGGGLDLRPAADEEGDQRIEEEKRA